MQDEFSSTKYLIIDEMSMVGRKTFGMIDRRLRQAFPSKTQALFYYLETLVNCHQ